jgi:two-component system, chemotaxis family, response regulator Rcp1
MSDGLAGSRPAEILLVEDNENDVVLTRQAFKRAKLLVNLHHLHDGEECMAFLRKQGEWGSAPTPDLILLDLNLPRKDGREVLQEIVTDQTLKHIPVVIMTTSKRDQDVLELYKLRCSGYIVKPVDFEQFARILQKLADYWFTVVVLPKAKA